MRVCVCVCVEHARENVNGANLRLNRRRWKGTSVCSSRCNLISQIDDHLKIAISGQKKSETKFELKLFAQILYYFFLQLTTFIKNCHGVEMSNMKLQFNILIYLTSNNTHFTAVQLLQYRIDCKFLTLINLLAIGKISVTKLSVKSCELYY